MRQKSDSFRVRLTTAENDAFKRLAEQHCESRSRIARKLIREVVNQDLDLLTDEQLLIKVFIRQLCGIANNLNQITRAINAGTFTPSLDINILHEINNSVMAVRDEITLLITKTIKRRVNCVPQ